MFDCLSESKLYIIHPRTHFLIKRNSTFIMNEYFKLVLYSFIWGIGNTFSQTSDICNNKYLNTAKKKINSVHKNLNDLKMSKTEPQGNKSVFEIY